MDATLDMKQIAKNTTFNLHVKVKHLRWWNFRLWLIGVFANLMRWLLGSAVEIDVDYDYDPAH